MTAIGRAKKVAVYEAPPQRARNDLLACEFGVASRISRQRVIAVRHVVHNRVRRPGQQPIVLRLIETSVNRPARNADPIQGGGDGVPILLAPKQSLLTGASRDGLVQSISDV